MTAEPVFVEIGGIQGPQFHPILPDLRRLGVVAPIRALIDCQVPCPPNMMNLLLRRLIAGGG